MPQLEGFDFFALHCDGDGKRTTASELQALTAHIKARRATDAIFIAHGFRNDEAEATDLYSEFLHTFSENLKRPEFAELRKRRFVVCGIFWPSKAFKESFDEGAVQNVDSAEADKQEARRRLEEIEKQDACNEQKPKIARARKLLEQLEDNPAVQNEFVSLVLSVLDDSDLDPTEGLEKIRSTEGAHLLELLDAPLLLPTTDTGASEGRVTTVGDGVFGDSTGETESVLSVFGSIFGRVGQFLNLTTWYLMKDRSGKVGANGTTEAVRAVFEADPAARIHLVGHSLGGRLMAACTKTLAEGNAQVDSLMLLQAAFSHYGLSRTRRDNKPGFFRAIIDKQAVRGPLLSTYSAKDTVVGKAYAVMSRLANDNTKAIGDENDEYGGIGRNGAQNAPGSIVEPLHPAGTTYAFKPRVIINLNGSSGLISNHGDVRNANVTYAFASSVRNT